MGKILKLYNGDESQVLAEKKFEKALKYIVNYNNYWDALHYFKQAAKLDPQNPEYVFFCGLITYFFDKEQACDFFSRAVSLSPENKSYRVWKGVALYDAEQYEEAKNEFLYVYMLEGATGDRTIVYLARTLNKLALYDQTIEFLTKGVGTEVLTDQGMFELGYAYFKNIRFNQAIHYFKQSISKNNTLISAYHLLSQIYCKKGEFDQAIAVLRDLEGVASGESKMVEHQIDAIKMLQSFDETL